MGFGIANSVLVAGHEVYGFDINSRNQAAFVAKGGQKSEISIAGAKTDSVVSVVLNGEQTEDILFGFNGVV